MKIKIAIAALSLALASGSASAQSGWYGAEPYDTLSTGQIWSVVRAAGLRPVSRPMLRGDRYIVHAVDRYGDTKRVVVDADFGDVIGITSMARAEPPTVVYRYGSRRMWLEDDGVAVLRPPAPVRGWRDDDRPRARLSREAEDFDLPPRSKPAARQKPDTPHTASINPTQRTPPAPRARPAIPAEAKPAPEQPGPAEAKASPNAVAPAKPTATPGTAPAAKAPPAETPKQTAAPRVILDGGPKPKSEQNASSGATRSPDATGTAATKQEDQGAKLPPVQPLN